MTRHIKISDVVQSLTHSQYYLHDLINVLSNKYQCKLAHYENQVPDREINAGAMDNSDKPFFT